MYIERDLEDENLEHPLLCSSYCNSYKYSLGTQGRFK